MRDDDKFLWVPLIALVIGIGLPFAFVDFAEDSRQEIIWIGIFFSMALFSYALFKALFKKFGNKYPKIKSWALNTITGITVVLFLASLMVSTLSAMFAALPLPVWIHFILGIALTFCALAIHFSEKDAH
jgi:4-hydroxybenzoate polyprenyltransferase